MEDFSTVSSNRFGDVLRSVRSVLGLSQEALAIRLGSTQRHVSFLETGRSTPTKAFVVRLCTELELSPAQRSNLFVASDLPNPFPPRAPESSEVTQALDMLQRQVLDHWPFPAMVIDSRWCVLRANTPAAKLFDVFCDTDNAEHPNLLKTILGNTFRSAILNWSEVCAPMYFRLQHCATRDPEVAALFDEVRARGLFEDLPAIISGDLEMPVYVPIKFALPTGGVVTMSSLMGKLASVQDPVFDGFEVELMVPEDDHSRRQLQALLST